MFAGITITIPNLVRIKQVVWILLSSESLQNTAYIYIEKLEK